jgi:sugar phosphate isomerase/epimerase
MKSAITVSLVEEARGGPFVFWDDLQDACERAGKLGFGAIEIFAPSTDVIDAQELQPMLDANGLELAALGTGAGMVKHGLSLTNADASHRAQAMAFVNDIVRKAGEFGASAIIGSMQGRWDSVTDKATALGYLGEALDACGKRAEEFGVPLIYEPLNRYETNLCNTVADGVALLNSVESDNVVLLADLFHMNIEEQNIADALRSGGKHIGHVHFVDSNRRPAGCGHMDYTPIAAALKEIDYQGYACAEAFPYPDPQSAAEATMRAYQQYFS